MQVANVYNGVNDSKRSNSYAEDAFQAPHLRVVPSRLVRKYLAVIDDDEAIQLYLKDTLSQLGFQVWCFDSAESFLQYINIEEKSAGAGEPFLCIFDVILCDVRLPGQDGLSLVQLLRKRSADIPIVLMTAYAQIESAVQAIRDGAYDYLEKPFDLDRLTLVIDNALKIRTLSVENRFLKTSGAAGLRLNGVVSQNPAMLAIYDLVKHAAPTRSCVMITGEDGVGKRMLAKAIHMNSDREEMPFISVDCSVTPESLLDSELFGPAQGLIQVAEGGTLFINAVDALTLSIQSKLMRVLRERRGDVRVVVATCKNLEAEVQDGRFREDLFYHLSVIPIHMPPLRQRREDIVGLARFFLMETVGRNNLTPKKFTPEAFSVLVQLPWKGNVRELRSVVEKCSRMTSGEEIDTADLPVIENTELYDLEPDLDDAFPTLKDVEKRYLLSVLRKLDGKKEVAAKVLGMSRRTLYRKLTKHVPQKPQM